MALSLNLYALRGQLSLPSPQPPPPQAPQVALCLTRSHLASPSRGWWRSSHFCSMYRLGFQVSQRSLRQPGWGGATPGLGSRAHSVGGSSFTARRGVIAHFLCFILQGSALASACLPFCGSLSSLGLHLWDLYIFPSLSVSLHLCHPVSAGLSLSRSLFLSLFHTLAPGPLHWLFPQSGALTF